MEGDTRRHEIMKIIERAEEPVSGTRLAELMGVSRQVIVQDIALIRANNKNILSTNKGYILFQDKNQRVKRSFMVNHTDEQIEDELLTIVSYGGRVLDVVVEHEIYGQITVDLVLKTARDVKDFVERLSKNKTKPLKELTGGVHIHTVEADTEELLAVIEERLRDKGYLLEAK